jgi:hypothetical protein
MVNQMKFAVTPAQVEAARSRLSEAGYPLSGDAGTVEQDGYRIGYTLEHGLLLLELFAKPRFVPMLAVKAKIRSLLSREGISEVT